MKTQSYSNNWWSEKSRYRNHYYPDEVDANASKKEEGLKTAFRVFIASIPFLHYLSPKLDMAVFFGIEGSVIYDHSAELLRGKRAFKNLMYLVDDALTLGAIFSESDLPGMAATVMETGMSVHRMFTAPSIRQKMRHSFQTIANVTSLIGSIQNNRSLKWVSSSAKTVICLLTAEAEWSKGNWIETASNVAQTAIKLFDTLGAYRAREA